MRSTIVEPGRRRVVEEARADHVLGVALGGAAQARVLAQPRQPVAGALGVVQAQHGGADDLEVRARRLEVDVRAAVWRSLRARRRAAGASSATSASTAASMGPCEERRSGTRVLPPGAQSDSDRWFVRPEAPERSFGNPAGSRGEPRGFASRPRGRFALSGGEPERCIGYGALDCALRARGRIGVVTPGGVPRSGWPDSNRRTSAPQTRRSNQAELHPGGTSLGPMTRAAVHPALQPRAQQRVARPASRARRGRERHVRPRELAAVATFAASDRLGLDVELRAPEPPEFVEVLVGVVLDLVLDVALDRRWIHALHSIDDRRIELQTDDRIAVRL